MKLAGFQTGVTSIRGFPAGSSRSHTHTARKDVHKAEGTDRAVGKVMNNVAADLK